MLELKDYSEEYQVSLEKSDAKVYRKLVLVFRENVAKYNQLKERRNQHKVKQVYGRGVLNPRYSEELKRLALNREAMRAYPADYVR